MGRAPCCSKVGLNRGPWTPEEDMLLSKHIEAHGEGNWRALPKAAGLLRCGKSCRLRWVNYLRPNVKRGNISEDEEDLIVMLHALLGNRWSLIAARMPGRTDNEIKNYWNTHLSKKLASKGLDPKTHKPIKAPSSAMKPTKQQNNKSSEGSTSSSSSAEQSSEEPQEAWETTMDMDTCSYSTGSCCLLGEEQQNLKEMPVSWRHKQKREEQQSVPVEEQLNVSVPQRNNKFNCASPSSVLNMYSPTASASNCESPTRTATTAAGTTNSQSSCLSPSSNSSDSIVLGASNSELNSSSWELPIAASDEEHQQQQQLVEECPLFEADPMQCPEETLQTADAQQVQMLEFIDEFLCSSSKEAEEENLFKEELVASSEFWDSLGKIELPDAPALCQSDLWDGLRDLVVAPSTSTSIDPLQAASNASQSCQAFQDNISELLFCA